MAGRLAGGWASTAGLRDALHNERVMLDRLRRPAGGMTTIRARPSARPKLSKPRERLKGDPLDHHHTYQPLSNSSSAAPLPYSACLPLTSPRLLPSLASPSLSWPLGAHSPSARGGRRSRRPTACPTRLPRAPTRATPRASAGVPVRVRAIIFRWNGGGAGRLDKAWYLSANVPAKQPGVVCLSPAASLQQHGDLELPALPRRAG